MSKTTIRKLFAGSLIALAGGLVLLAAAGGLVYASSSFVKDGPDVVGIHATPFGWVMIGLAGVAILVLVAAAITQFIAWVGAVIHTAELEDKTWFVVLLVTGLLVRRPAGHRTAQFRIHRDDRLPDCRAGGPTPGHRQANHGRGGAPRPAEPERIAAVTVGWLALVSPFVSVHRTTTIAAAPRRAGPDPEPVHRGAVAAVAGAGAIA